MFFAAIEDALPIMIPIIALMIPIVAILVKHQQRMAEIVHGSGLGQKNFEIDALKQELMQLRHQVNQQTIQMDTFLENQRQLSQSNPSRLEDRLGS